MRKRNLKIDFYEKRKNSCNKRLAKRIFNLLIIIESKFISMRRPPKLWFDEGSVAIGAIGMITKRTWPDIDNHSLWLQLYCFFFGCNFAGIR